jgi:ferredoxin
MSVNRNRPVVLCRPRGDVVLPAPDETLLAAALRSEVPLASSCGGKAVCGDCVVRIVAGRENLSPPDADELAWRKRTGKGGDDLRLACCLRVRGPAEVATTYW